MKHVALVIQTAAVVSHGLFRITPCGSHRTFSNCNAALACTWCSAAKLPSGCYRRSFSQSLSSNDFKCTSSGGQNVKTFAGGLSSTGDGYPAFGSVPGAARKATLSGPQRYSRCQKIQASSAAGSVETCDIKVATFDHAEGSGSHKWRHFDDAMSIYYGRSVGYTNQWKGILTIKGTVEWLENLNVTGWMKGTTAEKGGMSSRPFPDISSCEGLSITCKSNTPYPGFFLNFGNKQVPEEEGGSIWSFGYKSQFEPPIGKWGTVQIPFTHFTRFFDPYTGQPIKTCKEHPEYCPDKETLQDIGKIAVFTEGALGDVHLEIKEISAYGCTDEDFIDNDESLWQGYSWDHKIDREELKLPGWIIARNRSQAQVTVGPGKGFFENSEWPPTPGDPDYTGFPDSVPGKPPRDWADDPDLGESAGNILPYQVAVVLATVSFGILLARIRRRPAMTQATNAPFLLA
eukprot:gnl/MRDRNA2_/MRDRNA2_94686_c0_seq1.p1 gnl/MRDRNA2_/MRDRNA2_94686_c0~~gnl/MRDRNA2_/MRDRNA2_94686_c0_seq1.p1  ORF type:complete len:459 (+),score=54.73 gnl/MRDRNA2_/MRDRNA2_94686_c0_seq1:100-1476(+)